MQVLLEKFNVMYCAGCLVSGAHGLIRCSSRVLFWVGVALFEHGAGTVQCTYLEGGFRD